MNMTAQPHDPTVTAPEVGPPRRRAIPLLAGAAALLLAGGAGGYLLSGQGGSQLSIADVDPAASASFDPTPDDAGPGGFGGPGHHHGFGRGGRGAAGTIDSVDGTTITLTTRDGRKLTVTAPGAVPVILRSQGSVADLKPGQTILVSGSTGSDGSVIANRIAVGAKVPR